MDGDALGCLAVEVLHRTRITAGVVGGFGGDRIHQVLLDLARTQVGLRDAAGDAASVPSAGVCDDIGLRDHPGGLDRHQFRIARPETDAPQRAPVTHSALLAIALTAAAAIALPPRRPLTTRYDMPRGRSISSCLDCADPTKPT